MRSYKYIFIALIFLIVSCGDKEQLNIPEGILNKEDMVKVMTNIYIIDGATDHQNFGSGITMPADPRISYAKFLAKDGISYEEFKTSYDFYLQHPAELNQIYTEVLNEISRLQAVHAKK